MALLIETSNGYARGLLTGMQYARVFVDTPLVEAEARDTKGLYAKARAGELANFTGIDSPYEEPEAPELVVDTTQHDATSCIEELFAFVVTRCRA